MTKEDIQVRFFEIKDNREVWQAYGEFQPSQVHKQTAIWFRPPRYERLDITEPVKVFIQLKRPSDNATSDALPFEFLPLDAGRPAYWSYRRNLIRKSNFSVFNAILQNDAEMMAKRQSGGIKVGKGRDCRDEVSKLNRKRVEGRLRGGEIDSVEKSKAIIAEKPMEIDVMRSTEINVENIVELDKVNTNVVEKTDVAGGSGGNIQIERNTDSVVVDEVEFNYNNNNSEEFKDKNIQGINKNEGKVSYYENKSNEIIQNKKKLIENSIENKPDENIFYENKAYKKKISDDKRGTNKYVNKPNEYTTEEKINKYTLADEREFTDRNKNLETFNKRMSIKDNSYNEILKEVIELDQIYLETQNKLLGYPQDELSSKSPTPIRNESFNDAKTYSSLQLAFKNPVDIKEDVIVIPASPIINTKKSFEDEPPVLTPPPLPPKRARKAPETPILGKSTYIGASENSLNSSIGGKASHPSYFSLQRPKSHSDLAPVKKLPPTPSSTLPNPKKRGFLSKLFARKSKTPSRETIHASSQDLGQSRETIRASQQLSKAHSQEAIRNSQHSLQTQSQEGIKNSQQSFQTQPQETIRIQELSHETLKQASQLSNSIADNSNSPRLPIRQDSLNNNLMDYEKSNFSKNDERNITTVDLQRNNGILVSESDDIFMDLDLTEAEHYALYTAIAPHATQSEFDETSCYYAPVEGGRILSDAEIAYRTNQT